MLQITRFDLSKCNFYSDDELEEIEAQGFLKVFVEDAFWSKAYKTRRWDGFKKFYDSKNNFNIGLLEDLLLNLDKANVKYSFKDDYNKKPNRIPPLPLPDKLYDHQKEAVTEFFKDDIGIIIVPTRGGKTFIASEIIRQSEPLKNNFKTLFIVDTEDLFVQSVKEISKYLGVSEDEIGKINAGGLNPKIVSVGMIQTMVSMVYGKNKSNKRPLEKFLRDLDFQIVDEIQEYSSDKRMGVLKKSSKLKRKLGISATPFKQLDSEIPNLTIKGYFGKTCYEVGIDRLQDEGHLALDKVMLVHFDHSEGKKKLRSLNKEMNSYHDYLKYYIHENNRRNKVISEILKICKKNKWKTLVLFNSKKHGYIIEEITDEPFICGDHNVKERSVEKDNFLKGRGKTLLASNIFKKGITLPQASVLLLADGGLEGSNVLQKKGRILGAIEGKTKALMIDIMDVGTKFFSKHSLNRLEVYNTQMTKDRIEIHMENEYEFLEDSMKDWLYEKE